MIRLVIVVTAALVFAGAAVADVPPGMILEPVISARAAWVAHKPVTIYCASTNDAWAAYIDSVGTPSDFPNGAASAFGYTPTDGGTTSYLAPATCAPILKRIARATPSFLALGATLDVLTVESLHLRGEVDDGQTACDALKVLPGFLVAKWGFRRGGPAYVQVLRGAYNYHALQTAAQYHTGPCG